MVDVIPRELVLVIGVFPSDHRVKGNIDIPSLSRLVTSTTNHHRLRYNHFQTLSAPFER